MADIVSVAEENIEGYKVVRAFGGEIHESTKFNKLTQTNRRREMKNVVNKSIGIVMVQLVAACALAVTIFLATSSAANMLLTGWFYSSDCSDACDSKTDERFDYGE